MKRGLFQIFNVLMACIVLLSSTGFGLIEHSCQMRGRQKTVITAFSQAAPQTDCTRHQPSAATSQLIIKKTECCADDQRYDNVDVASSLNQLLASFVKNVTETVMAGVTIALAWLADWIFAKEPASVAGISASPTPLSGRDILTLVQRFLI